jgi:hypothetical protein
MASLSNNSIARFVFGFKTQSSWRTIYVNINKNGIITLRNRKLEVMGNKKEILQRLVTFGKELKFSWVDIVDWNGEHNIFAIDPDTMIADQQFVVPWNNFCSIVKAR